MSLMDTIFEKANRNKKKDKFMNSQKVLDKALHEVGRICYSDLTSDAKITLNYGGQNQPIPLHDFVNAIIERSKDQQWVAHQRRSDAAKRSARKGAKQDNKKPNAQQPRKEANNAELRQNAKHEDRVLNEGQNDKA